MKTEVRDDNFKTEVLESQLPVLVDFWAEWCMPCKMIEPVINEIAQEYSGRIKVCSLNIDNSNQIAAEYKVMSIPTLAVFKGGQVVDTIVGAVPKEIITEKLDQYL